MVFGALGLVVVAVGLLGLLGSGGAEVAYRWDKGMILPQTRLRKWRATSFAMAEKKMFLTLIDTAKEESGNGVVGAFNMSSSPSPDVAIFPFPNFYKINDPLRGKITTPIAVRTDDCHRLWLLDAAVQNISGVQLKTNPAIHVFNTNTSQLIRSFNIPITQWTSSSFFVNFVLDTDSPRHDCEETHGYFADYNRFHLLTYDFLRNRSELKSHPFFSPDPLLHTPEEVLLNPRHQDLNGLFGLALAVQDTPGMTDALYFHPLASRHEFRVATTVLKSEADLNYRDVEVLTDKGEGSEAGASVYDPDADAIFFAEVNTRKIGVLGVRRRKNLTGYFRYDFRLERGHIADLNVHEGALWVLVDDEGEVVMHKLSVAEITEEWYRSAVPVPAAPSCGSHAVVLRLLVLCALVHRFL